MLRRIALMTAALLTVGAAEAATIRYAAVLSGEAPGLPGSGAATLLLDDVANSYMIAVTFADLVGATTVAHIHGPTAEPFDGLAAVITTTPSYPEFPAGVTSGTYEEDFELLDAASYNPAFLAPLGGPPEAAAAFVAALDEGRAYFNLHTTEFPSGEIRGFFRLDAPTVIPVPPALPLALTGFGLLALLRRRAA
jgi:hypothetical protein